MRQLNFKVKQDNLIYNIGYLSFTGEYQYYDEDIQ